VCSSDLIWETFDALDRFVRSRGDLQVSMALVALPDATVLAASDPRRFPTLERLPTDWWGRGTDGDELALADGVPLALLRYRIGGDTAFEAELLAEVDISALLRQRHQVFWALLLSNGFLTVLLAAGGYVLVRRMLHPLRQLIEAVEQVRRGGGAAVPAGVADLAPEFRTLFTRFQAMAQAVEERQALLARLVEEERLAQLGRLASATAHEVNNPLAGLLTVVDTLRRRGEDPGVRASALDLLERGLLGIRNVVRAMLVAYKEEDSGAPLTARALDDLEVLTRHEVQRKRLVLDWRNGLQQAWQLDSGLVRQALLNLLLNACRVSPIGGRVFFLAAETAEGVQFVIEDHGPGLPPALRELLVAGDPSAPPGSGLGIWTVARLVRRLNGKVRVETPSEGGTRIMLEFPAQPLRTTA
jgi:signal transduction histidine kinase